MRTGKGFKTRYTKPRNYVAVWAGIAILAAVFLVASCAERDLYAIPDHAKKNKATVWTVTFSKNNTDNESTEASPQTKTVTSPATTIDSLPLEPTRDGYTFKDWRTRASGAGTKFTPATTVTKNITVYARWEKDAPGSHTVTFDKNNTDIGSTEASPQTITVNPPETTVGALPTEPKRTGWEFDGWNMQNDGKGDVFTEGTTVTDSITVYAKWTPHTYTVTFHKNNTDSESTDADPQEIQVTSPATTVGTLPKEPKRTGYNFIDWKTNANGEGEGFTEYTTVTKDTIVYAHWVPIIPNSFVVRFDSNGGSDITYQQIVSGEKVTRPNNPTRSNFTFDEWYKEESLTNLWNFETDTVTGDITLYARWKNSKWEIHHLRNYITTLDPKTTTVFVPNSDKRYVFYNNEATALMDANASLVVNGGNLNEDNPKLNAIRDVSFVYYTEPFSSNQQSFGIEARIRITKVRDSAPIHPVMVQVRQAIVMGAFKKPEDFKAVTVDNDGLVQNGDQMPDILGVRISPYGQRRVWGTRLDATTGAARQVGSSPFGDTTSIFPGTGTGTDNSSLLVREQFEEFEYNDDGTVNAKKTEGFADQEYVYKMLRTASGTYSFDIFSANGTVRLLDTFSPNNNVIPSSMRNGEVYLGFIISGVEVEISDIKIYRNGINPNPWSDPNVQGAVPYPTSLSTRVLNITANPPSTLSSEQGDYVIADNFPSGGITLTAKVVPVTLSTNDKTVTWSVEDGESVEVDNTGHVTKGVSSGLTTIKATSKTGSSRTFRFYLTGE